MTSPNNLNNHIAKMIAKIVMFSTVMILTSSFYGPKRPVDPKSDTRCFARTDYEQLRIGMTLTDVRSVLGSGIEVNRSKTTTTFVWENCPGSKITVTFEDGKLKTKAQSSLK